MPKGRDMIHIECISCAETIKLDGRTYSNYAGDIKCEYCGKVLSLEIYDKQISTTPKQKTQLIKIPNVPKSIEKDLNEAQLSFQSKSYRASAVMCRRVLEQLCHNLNAEGRTLYDKINDLIERGLISREFSEILTKIRIFGNIGAHFSPNDEHGIKRQDSKDLLDITLHIVKHVYEVQSILIRLRKRRDLA